ncbi:MAG: FAD-binding protein [Thermomicrobiales bacterium]|nr:FAD-binding protein [Thermomicrobiales bacterium]MCO5225276.1 FAD-binding protein [Thermomicrobiales bacterium]MCO5228591.1 FAD-binding protein [Thermomicrobiales bacterium]
MPTSPLINDLIRVCGELGVRYRPADILVFEADGSPDGAPEKVLPLAICLPTTTEQVAGCVRVARRHGVPVIARGAGTGLSGGAVPLAAGIVISLTRMDRVLEVNAAERTALVEPGVINLELSTFVKPQKLFFAPDPSSQKASTIGGNIAENAGGPHCLKYGVTTNHILGVEVVLPDGRVVWLDANQAGYGGLDLTAAIVGSEGMFGIVTRAKVLLTPIPESVSVMLAAFASMDDAAQAVTEIIASGTMPASLEIMDSLAMKAVEAAYHAGYPVDAAAVLLVEVDGHPLEVAEISADIEVLCRRIGVLQYRQSYDPVEQAALWMGRKMSLGAMGRLAPNYYLQDAVVPRSKLVQALDEVDRLSQSSGLMVSNVFHAGDGNLHPLILFDRRETGAIERVLELNHDLVIACVELGGTLSGEHGIGTEKRDHMTLIYTEDDLRAMAGLKRSFDPDDAFNPGKVLPKGMMCGEVKDLHMQRMAQKHGIVAF